MPISRVRSVTRSGDAEDGEECTGEAREKKRLVEVVLHGLFVEDGKGGIHLAENHVHGVCDGGRRGIGDRGIIAKN